MNLAWIGAYLPQTTPFCLGGKTQKQSMEYAAKQSENMNSKPEPKSRGMTQRLCSRALKFLIRRAAV